MLKSRTILWCARAAYYLTDPPAVVETKLQNATTKGRPFAWFDTINERDIAVSVRHVSSFGPSDPQGP